MPVSKPIPMPGTPAADRKNRQMRHQVLEQLVSNWTICAGENQDRYVAFNSPHSPGAEPRPLSLTQAPIDSSQCILSYNDVYNSVMCLGLIMFSGCGAALYCNWKDDNVAPGVHMLEVIGAVVGTVAFLVMLGLKCMLHNMSSVEGVKLADVEAQTPCCVCHL